MRKDWEMVFFFEILKYVYLGGYVRRTDLGHRTI
jgi:Txe/YoeB family toxin of Txe-Axe toxin-antitoxin module